jgi:PAS domain S-box-containing protein
VLGLLWLVDADHRLLRCVQGWSEDAPAAEFMRVNRRLTFVPGVGLPGRVWASGEPVWIEAVDEDPEFPRARAAAAAGLRSAVGLPLTAPGGVIGVIELLARPPRPADPELLDLLVTAGRQVGHYAARLQAELRLRVVEQRGAAITNAALDCIITMDAEGIVHDFNPAAERTFGYRREEAVGRELATLIIPPELREAHRAALARQRETGEGRILGRRLELTGMRKDGSTFPAELTVTRIGEGYELMFAGFVRDITERQRSRQELTRLLQREHATADTLQRALLPAALPDIPRHELAVRYLPGEQGDVAGGDWYDAFPLPEGRYGLVIGDIVGHGIAAAATMGRLRNALRAYAVYAAGPAEVLDRLHGMAEAFGDVPFATLLYLVLDPAREEARYASAGHLLPLIAGAGAEPRYLAGRPGPPIGAPPPASWPEHRVAWPRDALLVLFTDGLVEGPDRPVNDGLAELARVAGGTAESLEELTDRVLHELTAGRDRLDDIALLSLRRVG